MNDDITSTQEAVADPNASSDPNTSPESDRERVRTRNAVETDGGLDPGVGRNSPSEPGPAETPPSGKPMDVPPE